MYGVPLIFLWCIWLSFWIERSSDCLTPKKHKSTRPCKNTGKLFYFGTMIRRWCRSARARGSNCGGKSS
ncbi:hypothetical protein PF005_g12431 [Phytophthora fragariae]|uniref:Secreted protein n=1 Tax=Phytophthora fragariae TaxID=53985 RepID=A0A6A3XT71_9STRA|nr:hypothetical protein PF003_g13306 [Phytophthora fragariae]KAE8923071.1 hypothetical protein PF009_g26672 [Phytophthora fragariae]KAE8994999.1 hypothetical protein PF011_g16522 [Phytophthora fragariae]KAE9072469.1 hypothetical protein PF010_g25471 [Phytophthora fragariae]KAE9072884.1 hypothetical protein PF007_g26013 [Phytophthora fragariae]